MSNIPPASGGPGGSRSVLTPPEQVRVVRRYLSAVDALKPGRGHKRAAEAVSNRLLKIDELLISADPISRLHLTQERIDLDAELMRFGNGGGDLERERKEVERDFVAVARSYGERHGVTFAAWRQVGVDAEVLERAGIHRLRKPGPTGNGQPAPAQQAPQQSRRAEGAQSVEQQASARVEPPKPAEKSAEAKPAEKSDEAKPAAKATPAPARKQQAPAKASGAKKTQKATPAKKPARAGGAQRQQKG